MWENYLIIKDVFTLALTNFKIEVCLQLVKKVNTWIKLRSTYEIELLVLKWF